MWEFNDDPWLSGLDWRGFPYPFLFHCLFHLADDHFLWLSDSIISIQTLVVRYVIWKQCKLLAELVNKACIQFYLLFNRVYMISILSLRMLLSFPWFADLVVLMKWANSGSGWARLAKYHFLSPSVYHALLVHSLLRNLIF